MDKLAALIQSLVPNFPVRGLMQLGEFILQRPEFRSTMTNEQLIELQNEIHRAKQQEWRDQDAEN